MARELIITERELKRLLELQNKGGIEDMILKVSSSNDISLSSQWGINQWAIDQVDRWRREVEERQSDTSWTAFQAGYNTAFEMYVSEGNPMVEGKLITDALRNRFVQWAVNDV